MNIMEKIAKAYEILHDDNYAWFMASISMLLEEYCARHELKVCDMTESLYLASLEVNDSLGEYKPTVMSVNGIPS